MKKNAANVIHETQESEDYVVLGHYRAVVDALNTGNYERVADLLRLIETSARIADQTELIQISLQICLACMHCRSDIEWHDRARQEADERERELRQGLETILAAMINVGGQGPTGKQRLPHDLLTPHSRKRFTSEIRKGPDIWKQIQALLHLRPKKVSTTGNETVFPTSKNNERLIISPTKEGRLDYGMAEAEPMIVDERIRIQKDAPLLAVYCLGSFRVYQDEQPIEDWQSSKGKAIFKYLISHRERPIAKDILMDIFWPDADLDSARNNLNVAIYGLRQALRNGGWGFSHVLFQNDSYQFNPKLRFWIDYESFLRRILTAQSLERNGELAKAIDQLTSAEVLYQGEFLEEDRYEDWLIPQRRRLQEDYLSLLDHLTRYYYEHHDITNCATMCLKMLAVDHCHEEAHRRLMRCYYYQGQSYLALRQFHICCAALKKELDVVPSSATRELYESIRGHNGG